MITKEQAREAWRLATLEYKRTYRSGTVEEHKEAAEKLAEAVERYATYDYQKAS